MTTTLDYYLTCADNAWGPAAEYPCPAAIEEFFKYWADNPEDIPGAYSAGHGVYYKIKDNDIQYTYDEELRRAETTCWPFNSEAFLWAATHPGSEYIGDGISRWAFRVGNLVLKVPKPVDGPKCNHLEAEAYHRALREKRPGWRKLAPCRLLSNGVLVMVAVDTSSHDEKTPERPRC